MIKINLNFKFNLIYLKKQLNKIQYHKDKNHLIKLK